MRLVNTQTIIVRPDRQRKEILPEPLMDLANSIQSTGLIHPIVVNFMDGAIYLVAGERRLKAIETIWAMGQSFTHGGTPIPEGSIPCVFYEELSPLDAMEVELEENIRRENISWQERSEATARLFTLRKLQAEKKNLPPPTRADIAQELYPDKHPVAAGADVREELILARQLKDPDVAKASSRVEALKIIKRKEETQRTKELGERIGKTFTYEAHKLYKGNCLELLPKLEPAQFDVILTDPPYGINAQNFNDSGGKAHSVGHLYDDSLESWRSLMSAFAPLSFHLTKPQAHLYCFCDIENFIELRGLFKSAGWTTFRTPLIWHNPSSQRAPWPQSGPHRRYQICLYAIKGGRPVLRLSPDVLTYASDTNLNWAAQKPIGLYMDLLGRSCRAGDSVLDPFCGSGTIFPSAHKMKVRACGIEVDAEAYGIAARRLGELK